MKLHQHTSDGWLAIQAYGDGWIQVGSERHEAPSLLLLPDKLDTSWGAPALSRLTAAHMAAVVALEPEMLLLGTGPQQLFPDPGLLGPLIEARIGVEVMDSRAACRTYNILAGEGRRVACALLLAGLT